MNLLFCSICGRGHLLEKSIFHKIHLERSSRCSGDMWCLLDHLGCLPLGLSRSGSVIHDHWDHDASKELKDPCPGGFISSFDAP